MNLCGPLKDCARRRGDLQVAPHGVVEQRRPGRAADAIEILSNAGIGISYMYTFLLRGKGILVFRTDNPEKAKETIILNDMAFIAEKDLSVWA